LAAVPPAGVTFRQAPSLAAIFADCYRGFTVGNPAGL
jgi:hypothetical protein